MIKFWTSISFSLLYYIFTKIFIIQLNTYVVAIIHNIESGLDYQLPFENYVFVQYIANIQCALIILSFCVPYVMMSFIEKDIDDKDTKESIV